MKFPINVLRICQWTWMCTTNPMSTTGEEP
jgi:hypothetical protein